MEADYETQATLGEVLDLHLQASHDMSALLTTEVQRGRIDELEADAILYDFRTYLLKNRFIPKSDDAA